MAIPAAAERLARSLDPTDVRPIGLNFAGQLEAGETIASFTLTRSTASIAAGLEIMTGSGRDPVLINDGTAIKLWPAIDEAEQLHARFDSPNGCDTDIEATIETDSVPPQTIQKTFVINWVQQ